MATELTTTNGSAMAVGGGFTSDQLELLKRTIAPDTSDDEFALFCEVAKTTGLNPFQKQIYAIMRKSKEKVNGQWVETQKMTIQTGIDGYRVIAARTGKHAGTSDAEYGPTVNGFPEWARVSVKRLVSSSLVADFTATARWSEYAQMKDEYSGGNKTGKKVPSGQWPNMPYLMLAKCAEALALRKAFPAELSGVYTSEEMSQADSYTEIQTVNTTTGEVTGSALLDATAEMIQPKQLQILCIECTRVFGANPEIIKAAISKKIGREIVTRKALTAKEADTLISMLKKTPDGKYVPAKPAEPPIETDYTEMSTAEIYGELVAAQHD